MSKRVAASATIFCLILLTGVEAQKHPRSAASTQAHRSVAPHLGTIAGNVYFNERFKFTFSFPQGMVLEPPVPKPMPASDEDLAHFAPDKAALIEQSRKETSVIFHATDPASEITRLAVFAEDVSQSQIRTAKDYASRETGILEGNRAGITPVGGHEKVRVGRENFERRDLQTTAGSNPRYDIGLYGMVNGHAITLKFIATGKAEAERMMNDVVNSFRWNAAPIFASDPTTLNGAAYVKNQVYYNELLGLRMPLLSGGAVMRTDTLKRIAEIRGNSLSNRMGNDQTESIISRDGKHLCVLQLAIVKIEPKDANIPLEKDAEGLAERFRQGRKVGKPSQATIGGLPMYVLDIEEQRGSKTGYMRMYLARHKGHGLVFQVVADSASKMQDVAAGFEKTLSFAPTAGSQSGRR